MITIRLNAARSDVTVQEPGGVASRIEIDLANEQHRASLIEMIEIMWRRRSASHARNAAA